MDVDETTTASPPQAAAPEPYSAEWWQVRTPNELRDIIKRGFGVGQVAYDGAVLETERRAREAMRRVRDQAEEAEQQQTKARFILLGGILALLMVLMIALWLTR
jgi:CHASE3 domain sensor protein